MTKDEKDIITVDKVEYDINDFSPEQMKAFNHVQNIDRKISQAQFNIDEMHGGREYWAATLKTLLEAKEVEAVE